MTRARFQLSATNLHRLRAIVSAIDRELSCLSQDAPAEEHRKATAALITSWAELVELLAVDDPARSFRDCPVCRQSVRRQATECPFCREPLAVLPPGPRGVVH